MRRSGRAVATIYSADCGTHDRCAGAVLRSRGKQVGIDSVLAAQVLAIGSKQNSAALSRDYRNVAARAASRSLPHSLPWRSKQNSRLGCSARSRWPPVRGRRRQRGCAGPARNREIASSQLASTRCPDLANGRSASTPRLETRFHFRTGITSVVPWPVVCEGRSRFARFGRLRALLDAGEEAGSACRRGGAIHLAIARSRSRTIAESCGRER